MGARWLRNGKVCAEIARLQTQIAKKLEVSAEDVLRRLKNLAFYDIRKFFNEDGSLKKITELDDETACALQGMESEEAYQHFGKGRAKPRGVIKKMKIKCVDKGINLERLGRHIPGFFPKNNKVGVEPKVSIGDRVAAARKRVAERTSQMIESRAAAEKS